MLLYREEPPPNVLDANSDSVYGLRRSSVFGELPYPLQTPAARKSMVCVPAKVVAAPFRLLTPNRLVHSKRVDVACERSKGESAKHAKDAATIAKLESELKQSRLDSTNQSSKISALEGSVKQLGAQRLELQQQHQAELGRLARLAAETEKAELDRQAKSRSDLRTSNDKISALQIERSNLQGQVEQANIFAAVAKAAMESRRDDMTFDLMRLLAMAESRSPDSTDPRPLRFPISETIGRALEKALTELQEKREFVQQQLPLQEQADLLNSMRQNHEVKVNNEEKRLSDWQMRVDEKLKSAEEAQNSAKTKDQELEVERRDLARRTDLLKEEKDAVGPDRKRLEEEGQGKTGLSTRLSKLPA